MRIWKTLCAAAIAWAAVGTTYAQSNVTLYGVADVSLRYLTGATKDDGHLLALTNGAITQSRWGLIGAEDLGGGLKAIFRLESGFNVPNGTMSSDGVLFNRYAYVGLASRTYGTLTLGQQQNPVYQFMIEGWDPLTVGNYLQNAWMPIAFTGFLRGENNTALYTYNHGSVTARVGYAFSNIAGNFNAGSMKSVALAYAPSPLGAELGYTQTYNAAGFDQTTFNLQIRYRFHAAEFWLGYYNSRDKTGAVDAFLTRTTAVSEAFNPRKDNGFVLGTSYQANPRLKVTGAAYYDRASSIEGVTGAGGRGQRYACVALAEYAMSKAVAIYGTIDYNRMLGAAAGEAPNGKDQLGIATGIRYRF